MRFYGFDLPREGESVGVRRLVVMLKGLPPDAAIWRDQQKGWTQQDEWFASLLELTDSWWRNLFTAFGKKPQGKPLHVDRPGEAEERRRLASDPAVIRRVLGGLPRPERKEVNGAS